MLVFNPPDYYALTKVEYTTTSNAVFIIGANGSGKSKLGAWIEQQDFSMVHRIGAQRNLNFNENIALKSYSQAENFVFYGEDTPNNARQKNARWNWGRSYTTKLMDDFENVLAALIALKNNDLDIFFKMCRQAETENKTAPRTPCTAIDKLTAIWDDVFPQRELRVIDSKFTAVLQGNGPEIEYSANQMSDGERSVLYLAAQVLCVPQNKIMIVDEPEIHLHRSIMNRLWKSLEHSRPDCLFIYITHRYHITIETEGGHSFVEFGNRNAISYLASVINTLYTVKVPVDGKSHTTYNVGTIAGGTSVNTIAQKAELLYEYRSDSKVCLCKMQDMLSRVLEAYSAMGVKVSCELVGDRPCAGNVDKSKLERLIKRAADSVIDELGLTPIFYSASTDCNIPLSVGIPAVCMGVCIGGGLHTREEWLNTESLKDGSRLFMHFLTKYVDI